MNTANAEHEARSRYPDGPQGLDVAGAIRRHAFVSGAEWATSASKTQGEPSDAKVSAAHEAFWASGDITGGHEAIRAALRAAGGVR